MSKTKVTRELFDRVSHLTHRSAAEVLGVSAASIQRAHKRFGPAIPTMRRGQRLDLPPSMPDDLPESAPDTETVETLRKQLDVEKQKVADFRRQYQRNTVIAAVPENTFRFAVMSDLHFGSLYHDPGAVDAFCKYLRDAGVERILIPGDILEGESMYRGQVREVDCHGLGPQLDALSAGFPRGFEVDFITGNHDLSYYKTSGAYVGEQIAERMGWRWIGDAFGTVTFEFPGGYYNVGLLHPGGGSAYALSYQPQKIIESWEGGKKPNLLLIGHFHKAELMPHYRNTTLVQAGTFQSQTPFMLSKRLAAHVGGWIIEVVAGGAEKYNIIRSEFVAMY